MKRLLIAGALAVALASCGTLGAATPNEARTVAAAEVGYTEATRIETIWLRSGKATPGQAKIAKGLEAAAYADIVAARTAVANNDSATVAVALKLFNQALPAFAGYVASNGGKP